MYSGKRLTDIVCEGPPATARLLRMATALAELVAAMHDNAGSFGALSPATVFVTDDDAVRVLDAGLAPISARRDEDLLALGRILYCLSTGATPFGGRGRPRGDDGAPPSPIELNPRLPSGLVQLVRRAVHPDSAHRFHSAEEIVEELREVYRAPGSLESLLPAEHVSSSAAVKPPLRPGTRADGDDEQQELLGIDE